MKRRNDITLEYCSLGIFLTIIVLSFLIVIAEAWFISPMSEHPIARGIVEEGVRLCFICVFFLQARMISTPSISLSVAELIFTISLGWSWLGDAFYLGEYYNLIIFFVNIISLLLIGFIAGMLYLYLSKHGFYFLWGIIIIVPIRISVYIFGNRVIEGAPKFIGAVLALLMMGMIAAVAIFVRRKAYLVMGQGNGVIAYAK